MSGLILGACFMVAILSLVFSGMSYFEPRYCLSFGKLAAISTWFVLSQFAVVGLPLWYFLR